MNNKVIIIGPAHPLRGGLASYDERLARQFISMGYDTTIFTFSLQYPNFLFPGTTQYSSEPAPKDLDIKVCINSINPLNWVKIGNQLKSIKSAIIIVRYWLPVMGPCLGTILRIAKKNKTSKIVCIADNIIPHEKRPGDLPFTKYFIKPVDAFITMSEKVMQDLKKLAPQKPVQTVLHPLYDNFGEVVNRDEARTKLGLNKEDKILLFFGFIRKYKGLDILLDAMKTIKQTHPNSNIKLLIAGEYYEDGTFYKELITKNNIEDIVIQKTNFINDSDVRYYLCASNVVVQPYRSATQSGVTPLAYHFEIPMIVTNVGGLPSLVPDGKVGLVAEPNADDIARKILQYFELGEQHFLPHLREEKKRFSWDILANAIINS